MIESTNAQKNLNKYTKKGAEEVGKGLHRSLKMARQMTGIDNKAEFDVETADASALHAHKFMGTKYEREIMHTEMHKVFAFGSPAFFFKQVELALFLQCVFISFTFTQLIPLAYSLASNSSAMWAFGYLVPVVVNYYIFRATLCKMVQIRAVVELDKKIFGEVAEEAEFEKVRQQHLRCC